MVEKTELKTLKDMEINIDAGPNAPGAFSEDLCNAAKEWIKEIDKEIIKNYRCLPIVSELNGKREWIKHFFNLEEK